MQRLSGGFLVKQVVMYHVGAGDISELYELPNGQWQFGRGHGAKVVSSLEEVANLDVGTKEQVAKWLARVAEQKLTPVAMQGGEQANIHTKDARGRLAQRIAHMSDEVVHRMLLSIEQTLGPIDESMNQSGPANSHSEGYGDEGQFAPADTAVPFQLPAGGRWAQEHNPSAGYLTPLGSVDEKGHPVMQWHPTPEFHAVLDRVETGGSLDQVPRVVHDPVASERAAEQGKRQELASAGSRRSTAKRR